MGPLAEEIHRLIYEPAEATTFGLADRTEGPGAITRLGQGMDEAARNEAMLEFIFARLNGQQKALMRLAEAIDSRT